MYYFHLICIQLSWKANCAYSLGSKNYNWLDEPPFLFPLSSKIESPLGFY